MKMDKEIKETEAERLESNSTKSERVAQSGMPIGVGYSNPVGTEYPVMAYNNDLIYLINHPIENASNAEILAETIDSIISCGFNASIFVWDYKDEDNWNSLIRPYYIHAGNRGLRTILDISRIIPRVSQKYTASKTLAKGSITDGVKYNPNLSYYKEVMNIGSDLGNLWGICIMSSPEFISWNYDYVTAPIDSEKLYGTADLDEAYRTYMQNMNQHPAYLNLDISVAEKYIGNEIADMSAGDMTKFEKYMETIIDWLNLSMLSVNVFPILKSDKAPYYQIYEDYYYILDRLIKFSAKKRLPLWIYMLCAQFKIYHDGSTSVAREYPLPTEGILRFQAMTAIAYGFQGLVFWTYELPEDIMQKDAVTGASIPKIEFIKAPYDNDGMKTEIWQSCHILIPAIKLYGKALMDAEFLEARHVYGTANISDKFPGTLDFISYMGCIAYAAASGTGFVITRMDKGNDKYVVIVSHDPYNEQEITLTLYASCKWTEYVMIDWDDSSLTERVHEKVNYEATVSRTLKPGGIILIKYERY